MKKIGFVLSTILLIAIGCFCIAGTVYSQERDKQEFDSAYYSQMEQEYKRQLKEVLEEAYCSNSGITMTYVLDEQLTRTYQIRIHHKHINQMNNEERQQLSSALKAVPFADVHCQLEILFF
jgi:2-oxoglutarate dehydrogenase complex dehydrogenase (E1) component-like enzyme